MATVPLNPTEVNGATTNGHSTSTQEYDVIIVGAGFSGISAFYRLRKEGLKAHIFEAGMSNIPPVQFYPITVPTHPHTPQDPTLVESGTGTGTRARASTPKHPFTSSTFQKCTRRGPLRSASPTMSSCGGTWRILTKRWICDGM